VVIGGSFLDCPLSMNEPSGPRVELRLPVAAVLVDPHRGREHRADLEAAARDALRALLLHEPGLHQHLQVA
jgi:hypothetical protein